MPRIVHSQGVPCDDILVALVCRVRSKLGLTQAALARKIGLSCTTVQRWEQGIGSISPENVKRLKALINA
jgi:transcriptional regulator with XRE-family HTH domain